MAYEGICVKCGKCKGVCPTYGILKREDLSPRGRVHLATLVRDGIDVDFEYSASTCFLCSACEEVCPQRVKILDHILLLRSRLSYPVKLSVLKLLISGTRVTSFGLNSGVAFFPGCIYSNVGKYVLESAIASMKFIFGGIDLIEGICCGFPFRIYGKSYEFDAGILDRYNLILTVCATCSHELKRKIGFDRVLDFLELIDRHRDYFEKRVSIKDKVTFHYPCHLIRGVMDRGRVDRILKVVFRDKFIPMKEEICCGFGSSNIDNLADRASINILKSAMVTGSNVILVDCPSCHLEIEKVRLKNSMPFTISHIATVFG
ncbi:MAG: (Fe-S)-binding protein [Thermosulfidibacteraceae bacterium]